MRKAFLYTLTVPLLLAGVPAARAGLFSINAFKVPPAMTVLPQPRPAGLVPTSDVKAKNAPEKDSKVKVATSRIIWSAPAKASVAKVPVVKVATAKVPVVPKAITAQEAAVKPPPVKSPPVKPVAERHTATKHTATKQAATKQVAAKPAEKKQAAAKTSAVKTAATVKAGKAANAKKANGQGFYNPDANPPPIVDVDETKPLPPYPPHAIVTVGKLKTYTLGEQDTLLDVARYFNVGYVELRAANPGVDPWTPVPGSKVVIPSFKLIPRTADQNGILVNLAQMRLYYFKTKGKPPVTYPIGIGRDGLATPTGHTTIIRKEVGPYWYPTPRMRKEEPFLPAAVPPGPDNPLGTRALYLGWPEYRIHGTVKPWAVGRSVSSGCMRMYPRDILKLFAMVPVGTHVTVVNQPILVGWVGSKLYLEADPSKTQNVDIEINGTHKLKPLTPGLKKVIIAAAGHNADKIDWAVAKQVVAQRRGYPFVIANLKGPVVPPRRIATRAHHDMFVPSTVTRYDFNQ